MTQKKLYTREEFAELLRTSAQDMAADSELQALALDVLVRADRHRWVHQTSWFGQPVLNLAQDLVALQEIIWRTRPKVIIEVGVAWGGSLLFYSTLLEVLGGGQVLGIDIYIPDDLRERLMGYGKLSERIELLDGSSLDPAIHARIRERVGECREVMVVLDSFHTHEHVLGELRAFAPLVGPGQYLVCCDTIVEHMPVGDHRPRPWHPGNSPMSAVQAFLAEDSGFAVDAELSAKLLFSCNPGGYLVRKG